MKTINPIAIKLICFFVLLLAESCDSFVEVDLPKSQLINETVFEDYSTASAALTDIYSNIRTKGVLTGASTGISNTLGNYTDEIISVDKPNNASLLFYNNALLPSNSNVALYWNVSYNQIYAANSIIEGAQKSKNLTLEQKQQLQGEALFIRALLHFYLVNLFGDIPYITQTDFKQNSIVTRIPAQKIYEIIIHDLEDAASLLPVDYNGSERVRPNQFTAKALLSRAYLYNKSYLEAANTASAVINEGAIYKLEPDIAKVFLLSSKETIWQLQSGNTGANTLEASFFTFTAGPPPLVSLNSNLVNSFSAGDLRRSNWIKAISNKTSTWYHAYKYKENNATSASKEYSIVFRLAEQYLIRAEARAQQGELIGAKEDLSKIRNRAGLSNTTAVSKDEILDAILNERRWELFTERGHRFFDLKRNGELDNVLTGLKLGWNSDDRLLPIPQSELSTNPNLRPQNPGY
ncbi:RagB/SusD family nutrient uptake outer membrane protein [Flavobacterium sp. WLB]|uniref:RagB/SusD family nutrient uptake outer membrane protein n=1 Tax=Flavobacterium sp. WLB TaxID=2161662 RepID=UPI001FAF3B90|nr:RagB/SusD family nutrient uptake outer membrane protein [Flavobacterium sp. WLB]